MRWLTFNRKRLNVQEQSIDRKAQITALALNAIENPSDFRWLHDLLALYGLAHCNGILASLSSVPEQEGIVHKGIWVSHEFRFWEFAVVVSPDTERLLAMEQMRDVTDDTLICAQLPGTGASFGWLAIEALNKLRRV